MLHANRLHSEAPAPEGTHMCSASSEAHQRAVKLPGVDEVLRPVVKRRNAVGYARAGAQGAINRPQARRASFS
jgi:hypothetical protein